MKIHFSLALMFAATLIAKGQGTFIYDQQSATNGIGFGYSINQGQPIGQAFTPSLSGVGFVQLQLLNIGTLTNATVAVNLWADSLGGTLLGSTDPVSLPAGFATRTANFLFANPVTLSPGSTYYFQPVIQSGGNNDWFLLADFYNYPRSFFYQGVPQANGINAWFREGIVVPEPSAIVLLGLGLGGLFYARRVKIKRSPLP